MEIYVSSDQVSSGIILNYDSMYVSNGGTANYTTVNSWGSMYVYQGGVANSTTVNSGGRMYVYYGGTANSTTVNSRGSMYVSSGGTANSTTVNSGGCMYVSSGGTALNVTWTPFMGIVNILNGATVTFDSDCCGVYLGSASRLASSAAEMTNMTLSSFASMFVMNGGVANETVVSGRLGVCNGGATNQTTMKGGSMHVYTGGVANQTTVSEGSMYVYTGGVANSVNILGGYVRVFSGGTASIAYSPWQVNVVSNAGAVVSFLGRDAKVYYGDSCLLSKGDVFNGLTVSNGSALVYSGGVINETTVILGHLYVFGGVANETTVNNGSIYVSGGVANATTLNGGYLYVSTGGTANSTFVSGGSMFVSSGGLANATTVNVWGYLSVFSGGTANATTLNGGYLYVSTGGTVNSTTLNGGRLYVSSGGTANSTTLTGGYLDVSSGGTATSTTVNSGGFLCVFSGGEANHTTVNNGGMARLLGGEATSTTVNNGGYVFVESGVSTLAIKENGGYVNLAEGAGATFVSNCFSDLVLYYNNNASPGRGAMASLHSGTTANKTIVRDSGYLFVLNGGTANSTTVNDRGEMYVSSGGMANSITVNSGGKVCIYRGGMFTGALSIAEGAIVSAYAGSIIDFDVSTVAPGEAARINDLSLIQGAPDYAVTVSASQAPGEYRLADGATDFAGIITVNAGDGSELGTLSVGSVVTHDGCDYSLALAGGSLTLSVSVAPDHLVGTQDGQSWTATGAERYVVEYSTDNFEHVISVVVTGSGVDSLAMPQGTYSWRVRSESGGHWSQGENIVADNADTAPKVVRSDADGVDDLFFAGATGVWDADYAARHLGSLGDWNGTKEKVMLGGKGRIADFYFGSTDANVLLLTDAAGGDALFVDDVYTALPGGVAEQQSRLAQIDEIRAGAGDDVVDMTSQRFAYVGDGLTVRGGLGDDTIWANRGDNRLFGDAGNDRLVGASGDDVIVGGVGDDSMHGGGGSDVFTFCADWGNDTVEELADGSVTLWFASGNPGNWNAATLTYSDGANSVTVRGVSADRVTLKFGDDASERYAECAAAGAFAGFTSEKIFEEKGRGILAGV